MERPPRLVLRGTGESARTGLESADETSWSSLLESEDANIRSALHHLDRTGQANGLLQLTSALGRHWRNSGRWNHGQSWLGIALEQSAGSNPPAALLADAHAWRGRLAIESGVIGEKRKGSAEAIDAVDAALALAYEVDDPRVLLRCIEAAVAAHSTSDEAGERARALCVRGISLSMELGDRWWQAMLESWRGVQLRVDGDLMGAELASTTCRALARADGNRHMAGLGGWVLSSVLIELRRADEAAAVLRVAIEDNMSAGDRRSAAFCHLSLGTIQLLRNELVGAAEHLRDGLLLAQESSDWVGAGFGLIGFVSLASRSGNHGHAARILGGLTPDVDALCRMHPSQRRSLDRAVASASDALGPEMFERIVEQAAQLGWREATLDALDVAELVLAAPHQTERSGGEPTAAVENPNRLTTREIEVLRLIAEGCTNNEVGDRLFVSVGTVERHIANLYRKIGARRRADATVYAVRNGFLST